MLYKNHTQASGTGSNWNVQIHTPIHPIKNYYKESQRAAELVWSQKQGPVHVMYSGGVDSEYTLKLFLSMGMPVIPVIVRLTPNYNDHDTKYAFDFCAAQSLEPMVIDIDFDDFVKSGHIIDIAESAESSTYAYAATLYATSQIDGTVICNTGEPAVRLNLDTRQWQIIFNEYDYVFTKYFNKNSIPGTPFFTMYTSEMLFSFITDPRVIDLVNNQVPGKQGHQSSKWMIYNRHSGFNHQERPKYHGYENIQKSAIFQHENIKIINEFKNTWGGEVRTGYHTFISRMNEPVIDISSK